IQIHALGSRAAFEGELLTRPVDQDAPHRLGRGSEEMSLAFKLRILRAAQSQPRFVNERRRLESLPWSLVRHFRRREFAQFVVYYREQVLCSLAITRADRAEQLGELGHTYDNAVSRAEVELQGRSRSGLQCVSF